MSYEPKWSKGDFYAIEEATVMSVYDCDGNHVATLGRGATEAEFLAFVSGYEIGKENGIRHGKYAAQSDMLKALGLSPSLEYRFDRVCEKVDQLEERLDEHADRLPPKDWSRYR